MHPNNNSDPKQAPQAAAYGGYPATGGTSSIRCYQQQVAPPHAAAAYGYQQGPPQWTTGLCGCFEDPSNCLMTCCCPCVTFGQNAEIIDKGTTSCAFAGLIYHALSYVGCSCLFSFPYRSKLRGLYSLPEDPCVDCCVHCLLPSCAICQEYRELKNRGQDPSIGWIANAQRMNPGQGGNPAPPYITPGHMSR
ncbi:protein PLANT CADMIUM RESISTANCE 12 [Prunus yedoensis var. nudiflora]|uniref:Protein PLANT CADMIUM RESISTANCE 12 n=1 Tax=Prunus yedoensis var. nudiflora TaxID=2094558 RepID=A0A314YUR2_PRUYE|nr:protein PLANT CADMIUM RESISTANCE 12 [Prunus yedoensis var. nudiflora]